MSTKKLVKKCHKIVEDLEILIHQLNFMEIELRKIESNCIQNESFNFINVALNILLYEKKLLSEAINQKNAVHVFYSLCSIQNTYKHFCNEDLSWSKLWNDGAIYKRILNQTLKLLQDEEIGIRLEEFKEAFVKYGN